MSVQVSYKKQFLLGVMFLLVIFTIVEGIARFIEIQFPLCIFLERDAFKDTEYYLIRQICVDNLSLLTTQPEIFDPPIIFLEPNQHYPTININSHGFRGPEISKEKPEHTYRIFWVGGSTAFGSGSTSDETAIPGFLQKKFNESNLDVRVEVINAGISAFESYRETYYIKSKLLEFEPDLFIVYDGANDAWVNEFEVDSNGNIIEPKLVDDTPEENPQSDFNVVKETLKEIPIYRTPFVVWRYALKDITVTPINYTTSVISPELVSLWKNRWLEICEIGNDKGFKTLITIQPMMGVGEKPYTSDELYILFRSNFYYDTLRVNFQGMVDAFDELNNVCYKTADLRETFENVTETVYFDGAHMSDFGNEIISQKIFELSLPIVQSHS